MSTAAEGQSKAMNNSDKGGGTMAVEKQPSQPDKPITAETANDTKNNNTRVKEASNMDSFRDIRNEKDEDDRGRPSRKIGRYSQSSSNSDMEPDQQADYHSNHNNTKHMHNNNSRRSHSRPNGNNNNNHDAITGQYDDGEEMEKDEGEEGGEKRNVNEAFANQLCHHMDPCDMLLSFFCPCITYGQTLELLDPVPKESTDACHTSTGCVVWTGIVGISALAIQIPLLIPNACSWFPTTYLGGVFDARELLMILPYWLPHWLCHLPFRYSVLGMEDHENNNNHNEYDQAQEQPRISENCCNTCMETTFCCCFSLASMKSWAKESNMEFIEEEAECSKLTPFSVRRRMKPPARRNSNRRHNNSNNEDDANPNYYANNNNNEDNDNNYDDNNPDPNSSSSAMRSRSRKSTGTRGSRREDYRSNAAENNNSSRTPSFYDEEQEEEENSRNARPPIQKTGRNLLPKYHSSFMKTSKNNSLYYDYSDCQYFPLSSRHSSSMSSYPSMVNHQSDYASLHTSSSSY